MTEQTLDLPPQNEQNSGEVPFAERMTPSSQLDAAAAPEDIDDRPISAWGQSSDGEDFDYIPVSPWAPISLCLGLLGLTGFIGIFGLYVAFFGIFIGIAAIARIRASDGFVKGSGIAAVGLVLSIASFFLGSAKMAHAYSTEVPEGFARVNFPKDVAEKQFVTVNGFRKLHPDVASLIGTKVYLKGFMWLDIVFRHVVEFYRNNIPADFFQGGCPRELTGFRIQLHSRKLSGSESTRLTMTRPVSG